MLKRLFSRTRQTSNVRSVYERIVAQARQSELYSRLLVPDTVDGRFDMIILHTDAVMGHLQQGDAADREFAQSLIDEVFRDMDRSLREMGVGDMGVGKRVKKMATVYFGRAKAYAEARSAGNGAVAEALWRNVYASDPRFREKASELSSYAARVHENAASHERAAIRNGQLHWADDLLAAAVVSTDIS
jgi:cytochrome b pre-mRNA-processing protein 3